MRKSIVILFSLLLAQYLSAASIQKAGYKYLPDQVVVKLAGKTSDVYSVNVLARRISLAKGVKDAVKPLVDVQKLKSVERAKSIGLDRIYIVQVAPMGDVRQLCEEFNMDPEVEWAEPVYIIPQHAVPNDPKYVSQYHLPQIMMPGAWDVVKGDSSVVIAIIDSGVDYLHKDLKDQIWINPGEDIDGDGLFTAADSNGIDDDGNGYIDDVVGWDWVTGVSDTSETPDPDSAPPWEDGEVPDNDPMDVNGHGTHCAGLAAATTNNGDGVASVSWGCKIMPLRIGWTTYSGNGYGLSTWMSQAFIYAGDNGVKVANLSYGNSQTVLEGARYAFDHDVAIATSAGNENGLIGDPLSVAPWAMTVTAVDRNDYKTGYSNFGPDATVAAPGGAGTGEDPGLWSTYPKGNYGQASGTSMASPVTAGLLGLVRSQRPEWSASEVMYQVVGTADNIDSKNPEYAGMLGGRINGYRAVTETVIPEPKLSLEKVDIIDAGGNNNGIADPGETIRLVVHIKNRWAPTSSAMMTLLIEEGEERLTVNVSEFVLDSLYGIETAEYDHNNSETPFEVTLASALPPSMIPMAVVVENAVVSDTFKFNIPVHPMVLFVDDASEGKIRPYYEGVFNKLGIVYDYWDNYQTIDIEYLSKFPIVIWACEWVFPSLDDDDRSVLSAYLRDGGNLFLSGQDLAWDLADATSELNEYYRTSGTSKTWLEDYINVDYLSDDGGIGPVAPANGSFFDLPPFNFYLPNRAAENQYPDEIRPREGAYSLLNYSNGEAAAVGSDDPYSTIFFSFGGLEAITDEEVRGEVTRQIINHFAKLDVKLSQLANTEFTGPFTINADVQTAKSLEITELWYRYNEGGWQNIAMNDQGSGQYTADLPVVSDHTDIEYFVFFKTTDGMYNAKTVYKFHSGPDSEAPLAEAFYLPENTVDMSGKYSVAVAITDFVNVDTVNVKVHFNASTGYQDSVALEFMKENIWRGNISFPNTLSDGDVISYYITFSDLAQTKNYGRYPETGNFSFSIADSVLIDGFEAEINRWANDGSVWSHLVDSLLVYSGVGCLISGDGASYPINQNTIVELQYPLNLQGRNNAQISYYATLKFESSSDSAFFEVKEGDAEWIPLQVMASRAKSWTKYETDLTPYCGVDHDPVFIRFRFKTDENTGGLNRWGIKIDDLSIVTNREYLAIDDLVALPEQFKLLSAYPNPFNSSVNIPYALPESGEVRLRIYNMLGQEVYKTTARHNLPGYYNLHWNGKSAYGNILTSGIYFILLEHGRKLETSKILFLK
jgi:subtilisin family serine protease